MNRKGNILDFFFIMPILFLIGVVILISFIIINIASNVGVFQDTPDANTIVQSARNTILSADNIMLFVVVGLSLFVIISASMVNNNPAFFIVSFILLCIAITVAAVISNSFWNFWNQDTILSAAQSFPKIRFIMDKLPFYVLFMGIAASISAYVGYARE